MIGIAGGCRREELYNISLDDIQETQTQLVITIPCTKTNQRRTFTVIDEVEGIKCVELFRKYVSLRLKHVNHRMLFLGYRNSKCTVQRVGIHTIGGMPKQIALFLGLQDPDKYTGHSFRRTSATLLANAGADLAVLKRHGAWKSSSVAEKYIEDSLESKNKIARMILNGETFVEVLQQQKKEVSNKTSLSNTISSSSNYPPVNIEGNTNCTINLNINI
jgi:integrase